VVQVRPGPPAAPLSPAGRMANESAGSRAPAAPLDLHEGLSHPAPHELPSEDGRYRDPRRGGCHRWPEGMFLVSAHGERVPGRCKATNLCDYCAKLAAVENAEMLALDAMEGEAPEVWAVLTTRTATLDMGAFYKARELVMRALRRRWPRCRYAALLEFTTGYGPRSGGLRRPHWNLLLKGIPAADVEEASEVVVRVWCGQVDAEAGGQHVKPIHEAGGLMRYIALHFQKESQAPPEGFRGQRFNCSRDYFTGRTRAEAREDAKDALWEKRQLWKAEQLGLEGDDAEDFVDRAYLLAETSWRLYHQPRKRVEPNPGLGVPVQVLEAAWRWRDEQEQIADAREGVRHEQSMGQQALSGAAGAQKPLPGAESGAVGAASSPGRPATSAGPCTSREEVRDGVGAVPRSGRAPHPGSCPGHGNVAERPEGREGSLDLQGGHASGREPPRRASG
jgi:hypothetical protein